MSNIIRIDTGLTRANASLYVANKLLTSNRRSSRMRIYMEDDYKANRETAKMLLDFVFRNFWHFLPLIIKKVNNNPDTKPMRESMYRLIRGEFTYEYPTGYIHFNRLKGVLVIYNPDIETNAKTVRQYRQLVPALNSDFKNDIVDCLDGYIIGNVVNFFSGSSLGKVIGFEITQDYE